MSIAAVSSSASTYQASQSNPFAKIKEDFDNLGKALQSGSIADAKAAFAQLQKDTPTKTGSDTHPMSADIASLGKALDSGDIKAAQNVYAKIQDKMSQGPSAGGQAAGGGKPGGSKTSGSSSASSTVYDDKDTNKDGTVSIQEELAYALTHLATQTTTEDTTGAASSASAVSGGIISTKA